MAENAGSMYKKIGYLGSVGILIALITYLVNSDPTLNIGAPLPNDNQIFNAIDTLQDSYFAANGQYFEGDWIFDQTPTEGVGQVVDWDKAPPHKIDKWSDAWSERPLELDVNIRVDEIKKPDGTQGYIVFMQQIRNGSELWERSKAFNENASYNKNWYQIPAPIPGDPPPLP